MLAELILDFLPWPGGGHAKERGDAVMGKVLGGAILVQPRAEGAIKRALNESGWLADEVVAAGDLRQGKEPSLVAMLTGTALVELVRPRRSKALPRHFVLALTRDRIVAFGAVGGGDENGPYELWIRPGERGSWPRTASVRLVDLEGNAGTLVLGAERVPVWRPNPDADPSTDEVLEVVGG
jgi:hypothetical protein